MANADINDPTTWRLATTKKRIPYKLIEVEGEYTYNDGEAVWSILIPIDRLADFREEMFPEVDPGDTQGNTNPPNGGFTRLPRPTFMPGDPSLVVTNIKFSAWIEGKPIDPYNSDTFNPPEGTYGNVIRVDVTYSSKEDVDYMEVKSEGSGEYIAISESDSVKYDEVGTRDTPYTLDEVTGEQSIPSTPETHKPKIPPPAVAAILPLVNWSITVNNLPSKFFEETQLPIMRALAGRINASTLSFLYDAPPETILFLNWSHSQTASWRIQAGKRIKAVSLTMNFAEKRVPLSNEELTLPDSNADPAETWRSKLAELPYGGHNHYYIPGEGWRRLHVGTEEKPVYPTTDLMDLLVSQLRYEILPE